MKFFVAGARGMVGQALVRALHRRGENEILEPTRQELDLLDQRAVFEFLEKNRPDCVIVAAAKVGGILANSSFPASFLYENLMIASNLIHGSHLASIERLLFLGSTCIYPRMAPQPIVEDSLLTGPLEKTNEAYALAKICGVKLTEFYNREYGRKYISAMPTNLYGPKDNYHPDYSHVIPGLIGRFHKAKKEGAQEVVIWGSGTPQREFLYVDDLAEASLFLLDTYFEPTHINVGSDDEVTIRELASHIKEAVGFKGKIVFDPSKPDGTPRKKTDLTKIRALGWRAKTPLKEGLQKAYDDFLKNV